MIDRCRCVKIRLHERNDEADETLWTLHTLVYKMNSYFWVHSHFLRILNMRTSFVLDRSYIKRYLVSESSTFIYELFKKEHVYIIMFCFILSHLQTTGYLPTHICYWAVSNLGFEIKGGILSGKLILGTNWSIFFLCLCKKRFSISYTIRLEYSQQFEKKHDPPHLD